MTSSGGCYEFMVWIEDKAGQNHACSLKNIKCNNDTKQLTEEEKALSICVAIDTHSVYGFKLEPKRINLCSSKEKI